MKASRVLSKLGSVKGRLEQFDSELKLSLFKIRSFQPHLKFEFERGQYLVKTAENGRELEACLKLRFDVFHKEYAQKKRTTGVDVDKLDFLCDHLVIFDKRDGSVIGTYRLNSSRFTDTFYCAGEFKMDQLLKTPGHKLELGRACIHKDHRNGVVITLLWRGIAEYLGRTETKLMFGCASVKTTDANEIAQVTKYLDDRGVLTKEFDVVPTKKFQVKNFAAHMQKAAAGDYNEAKAQELIPPLLSSYLRMNAKLCYEPALDRDFGCIDFLTVVDCEKLPASYKDKYKV